MTYNVQVQDLEASLGIALSAPTLTTAEADAVAHQPPDHRRSPFTQSRDYLEALRLMEAGAWQWAVPLLRALQAQHPGVTELDELLQMATFHADLEQQWADRVTGRQAPRLPVRLVATVLTGVMLTTLLIGSVLYYGRIKQASNLFDQSTALLQQAQTALATGQYQTALTLFDQLLATQPTDPVVRQGQMEALHQLQFIRDYKLALDYIAAGDHEQALALLTTIHADAPNYRDVARRIVELDTLLQARRFFADAEAAFGKGLWLTAITNYEQLRRLDGNYETAAAQTHLATAYFNVSQQIVAGRPNDQLAPGQALTFLQKALQLKPTDALLKKEVRLLQSYREGERWANQANYEAAIGALLPIYETHPTYFGGYVRELLYRSYVAIAERYVAEQALTDAFAIYQRVISLELDQEGVAAQRMTALGFLLTPTPTASLTPLPTPTAPPPLVIPVPAVNSVAPTPVVTAPLINASVRYPGWIAFRSQRYGHEEIFVMRADGSELQPASAAVSAHFAELYEQQQVNAEGNQRLYVKQVANLGGDNIFKAWHNLTVAGESEQMLTRTPGAESDPVWSPDGQWIAFVAEHTGHDEIWLMNPDGEQLRQLTFSQGAWNNHPSFAPDGQTLVFSSNRTGLRQIWRMAADGTDQQNLSNNEFEDWDPVWLRE